MSHHAPELSLGLYLAATPIGNLKNIAPRSLCIL